MKHGDPHPKNQWALAITAVCLAGGLAVGAVALHTEQPVKHAQGATEGPTISFTDTPPDSPSRETTDVSSSPSHSVDHVPRFAVRHSPSHVPAPTPTRTSRPVRTHTPAPVPSVRPTLTTTPPAPPSTITPKPRPTQTYVSEQARLTAEVLALFNKNRAAAGLKPVARYTGIDAFAQEWADHMATTNCARTLGAHDFQKCHRTSSPYRGEIIAYGYPTAQAVVDAWMNSPGHRAIIMDPSMTKVGIGVNVNGYYWAANFS